MVKIAASLLVAGVLADDQAKYNEWQAVFGTGENSATEFQVFQNNLRLIEETQANDPSATYDHMGPFAATSQEDFSVRLGYRATAGATQGPLLDVSSVADSYDWRDHGAVNAIKDQGQCGSCWAFSTTGSTEGAWQLASSKLVSLSEQQLVDCATATSNGCQGGSMAGAIQYESGTDMATEQSYPYKAADGTCKSSFTTAIAKGGITGYKSVGNFLFGASVTDMKSAIAQQPVSIAIQADQSSFQSYKSGVLSSGCGTQLDHGVLAAGYGSENGQDYWLVKNSWGTSWGSAGYIKIGSATDVCGVLKQPVYPQASASVAV